MRNTAATAYIAVPTGVTVCSGHVRRNQRSRCRNPPGHLCRTIGHVPGISGHVGPEYSIDGEIDGIEPTTLKPVSLGGTFYLDDFVLSVGYSNTSSTRLTNSSSKQSWDVKSTTPSFGVGYFVFPTTLVSISNSQNVVSYASVAGSTSIKDRTTTKTGLTAHTVMPLSGTDSIVGEIYLQKISYDDGTKTQNNNDFGIDVKYFPAMNYYVGGGFVNNSGDRASTKGTTFKLAAGYQFTPRLGLLFETSKFKVSDDAQKTSSTSSQLQVVYRF